ncbi:MAG: DUF2442 domain-containing protein [Actinomycetota bacterium]
MSAMPDLVHVTAVEPVEGFILRVSFSDGTVREVDTEQYMRGPIFDPLRRDPELFRRVRVESGTVVWPNGADIDPVVLRGLAEPAWKEDESGPRPTA